MKKTSDNCPVPMPKLTGEPIIGKKYHVSWAHPGCVWILKEINGDKCVMKTSRTKNLITVDKKDLRGLRSNNFKYS